MSLKIVLLFALVVLFCAVSLNAEGPVTSTPETQMQWAQFQQDYGHAYASESESDYRYQVFLENLGKMKVHQQNNPEAFFGMTSFLDMTTDEFVAKYASPMNPDEALEHLHSMGNVSRYELPKEGPVNGIPSSFDWRSQGNYVTAVKDQGQCGSCWAFAATELIESANAIKNRVLLTLAPQEVVDCSGAGSCGGGYISGALQWATTTAVVPESSYPYLAANSYCKSTSYTQSAQLASWKQIAPSNGPTTMQSAIMSVSPAAFGVWGDMSVLQYYQGGVISNCGTGNGGHAMVIVGWTSMSGKPVWIVRNSWNTWWGYSGYVYFSAVQNACGLNNYAYVATAR